MSKVFNEKAGRMKYEEILSVVEKISAILSPYIEKYKIFKKIYYNIQLKLGVLNP